MNKDEILKILNGYINELDGILGRFSKTRDGLDIDSNDNYRMRELLTETIDLMKDHMPRSLDKSQMIISYFNEGINNFLRSSSYESVEKIKGVVKSMVIRIERTPLLFEKSIQAVSDNEITKKIGNIEIIANRFHSVVMQLKKRHEKRAGFEVKDEYDVQDLFHALLKLFFDDIRPEDCTPSYAGSSSRIDFLLPEIKTIVEIKMTRKSMTAKDLGEQLIIDIVRYKTHPKYENLVCLVYDPEGLINNPRGIENDLTNLDKDINVVIFIVPRHE